jgi:hypothetical protein
MCWNIHKENFIKKCVEIYTMHNFHVYVLLFCKILKHNWSLLKGLWLTGREKLQMKNYSKYLQKMIFGM